MPKVIGKDIDPVKDSCLKCGTFNPDAKSSCKCCTPRCPGLHYNLADRQFIVASRTLGRKSKT